MNAPVRLRDDPRASAAVRQMFASSTATPSMSASDKARLRRSVLSLSAPAGASLLILALKGVALAAAFALSGVVVMRARREPGSARPSALAGVAAARGALAWRSSQ